MSRSKDLLLISIFTLITVFAWIVFEVYHTAVTSTITEIQQKLTTPLNSKLDPATLNYVRQRIPR